MSEAQTKRDTLRFTHKRPEKVMAWFASHGLLCDNDGIWFKPYDKHVHGAYLETEESVIGAIYHSDES